MVFSGAIGFIQYHFIFSLILLLFWEKLTFFNCLLAIPFNYFCNFSLIFILTGLGFYTSSVMWGVFLIEIALLSLLLYCNKESGKRYKFNSVEITPLFILAFLIVIYTTFRFVNSWGDIFYSWDGIVSWNRWALDWANNRFPQNMMSYPQLHSALLSINYLFINNRDIPLFSLVSANFTPLMIVLLPFVWGIQEKEKRSFAFLLALIMPYIAFKVTSIYSNNGYADGSLLYMSLVLTILLSKWNDYQKREDKDKFSSPHFILFLSTFVLATATSIKLTGIFLTLYFFTVASILTRRRCDYLVITKYIVLYLLLITPWNLYQIVYGGSSHTSIGQTLYSITPGTVWERPLNALHLLFDKVSFVKWVPLRVIIYLILLTLLVRSIRKSPFFRLLAIFGVIYFFIWGFWSSYDTRNFALAVPLLVFPIVDGLVFPFWEKKFWKDHAVINLKQNLLIKWVMIFFISLIMGLNFYYPSDYIYQSQMATRRSYGDKEINDLLYEEIRKKTDTTLLTTNELMTFLPDMPNRMFSIRGSLKESFVRYPKATILYIANIETEKFTAELEQMVKSGTLKPILLRDKYNGLYAIRKMSGGNEYE